MRGIPRSLYGKNKNEFDWLARKADTTSAAYTSMIKLIDVNQESHVTQTSHAEKAFDLTPEAASASPLLSKSMVPQHFVCVNKDK